MAHNGIVIAVDQDTGHGTVGFARLSEPVIFLCNNREPVSVGDRIRVDRLPKRGEILRLDGGTF